MSERIGRADYEASGVGNGEAAVVLVEGESKDGCRRRLFKVSGGGVESHGYGGSGSRQ